MYITGCFYKLQGFLSVWWPAARNGILES